MDFLNDAPSILLLRDRDLDRSLVRSERWARCFICAFAHGDEKASILCCDREGGAEEDGVDVLSGGGGDLVVVFVSTPSAASELALSSIPVFAVPFPL
jgi:hypothetical protein